MTVNPRDYEVTKFSAKVTNTRVTKKGYRVGEFLIVTYSDISRDSWRIFRSQDGLECLKTTFQKSTDALQFAEWIREHYEYFFFIWSVYPHAELFRWAQFTIPDGKKYWEAISQIKEMRNTTWNEIQQILS
jgi:hypothetical protein